MSGESGGKVQNDISRFVDVFTLSTQNLTQDYSNVTFHHSRLMGVSDIKNAVSINLYVY